jgi:hypothetical protein
MALSAAVPALILASAIGKIILFLIVIGVIVGIIGALTAGRLRRH